MTVELRKGITEVWELLEHMERSYTDKIPVKLREFLVKNKLSSYKPQIDYSKKISEMGLNSNTKNILGIIYYKYWCDECEKINFMKKIKSNELTGAKRKI